MDENFKCKLCDKEIISELEHNKSLNYCKSCFDNLKNNGRKYCHQCDLFYNLCDKYKYCYSNAEQCIKCYANEMNSKYCDECI